MGSVRISVVIPHLNQSDMLVSCVRSLIDGARPPDEIIVVDNGSSHFPKEVLEAYPHVQLLQEHTPGPGPARNKGVAAAKGDILAFIDADCVASREWLSAASDALEKASVHILGGDVRIACVNPSLLTQVEAYESVYAYRMDRYIAEQGFTGTGNLVMRRAVFEDVGPFAGVGIAEDRDWGQRATAKGYQIVYHAPMRIYHPARQNFTELFRKWDRQLGHDYNHVLTRGLGRRMAWAIKACAMGLSVLAEIPRISRSDRLDSPRARLFAVIGLSRLRFYRMYRMLWLLFGGSPLKLAQSWNRD